MTDPFVILANINRFENLLRTSIDEIQRRTVEALLASEQRKVWELSFDRANREACNASALPDDAEE